MEEALADAQQRLIEIGETVGIITDQRDALQAELKTRTEELSVERKKNEEAMKTIAHYTEELRKIAVSTGELLNHLKQRQAEGDALRTRLRKVLDVQLAASAFISALEAGLTGSDLAPYRETYNGAMLKLDAPDNVAQAGG